MQADMRVLRLAPEPDLWIDTEPDALEVARRHLQTYKIGREVEVEDDGEERAILSLIGPAAVAIAAAPSPPLHGSERRRSAASPASSSAPRTGST